jgi:hypothetical protein
MTTHAVTESQGVDVSADRETLTHDGIVGLKGAFSRDWAERMRGDMLTGFWEAIQRPGGAVGRDPRRWYVEIHPQAFGGFADLCGHAWVTAMCRAVLEPDYKIVEIGFDTPFEGAMNQPWHRDFPSPPETWRDHRITSLAFNLTGVDVTPDWVPSKSRPARNGTTGAHGNTKCSHQEPPGHASPSGASASSLRWATFPVAPR